MTVQCKLCKRAISSVGPPNDNEAALLMELMARHLVSRHKDKAIALKQDVETLAPLLTSYLMIVRFVDVPPTATVIKEVIEAATQALGQLFAEEVKPVA